MGCGNSRSVTAVASTVPQVKPGPASNETNNNQDIGQPGKISPQNNATESPQEEGTYINALLILDSLDFTFTVSYRQGHRPSILCVYILAI